MKLGAGFSRERDPQVALQEAYRKSLQKIGATRADFVLLFYSYDYGLDPASMAAALKKVFRDIPHAGSSTWSAWFQKDGFESDTGILVLSLKDLKQLPIAMKVHSLREKADLWSSELGRQIAEYSPEGSSWNGALLFNLFDSLNFVPGAGFLTLERQFPGLQICGFGASYSVPQVSLALNGEVYFNSLVSLLFRDMNAWMGLGHNILPELNPIEINRMSENLVIEIDHKPAFYKLCEHLMTKDDLPMMSPDSFRKHMGDLYIVEVPRVQPQRQRSVGDSYQVISLLGSEMTTGMVAVAQELDFKREHYLGQKKSRYAEETLLSALNEVSIKLSNPSCIWLFSSVARLRDRERKTDDLSIVKEIFPNVPVMLVASHGEFLGGANQFASLFIAFP